MANYQQFQRFKRPSPSRSITVGRVVVLVGIVIVVYLIGRALFGGTGNIETAVLDQNGNPVNTEQTTNANVNSSTDANTNGVTNGNTNTNANTNTAANVNAATGSLACSGVISRGSTATKAMTLTFNVGTTKEGQIQSLLDTLKQTGTPADFFARGDIAEDSPDLITKISSAGFPVHNLSYNHPHFSDLPESGVAEQLSKAETAIAQRTNATTKPFFRPPYGEADQDVVTAARDEGYCTVTWTVDALDWSTEMTAAQSKERVLNSASNGAIILMQASNATSAEILSDLISQLKSRGYALVSLRELIGL